MSISSLVKLLVLFLEDIKADSESYKIWSKEELLIYEELYYKTVVQIEEYNKGIKKSNSILITKQREKHVWLNFKNYFSRLSNKKPILGEIIEYLKKDYKGREVENNLFALLNYVLFNESESSLTKDKVQSLASRFEKDINGVKPDWFVKIWVDGIWLDSKIEVADNLIIRIPDNEDLSIEERPHSIITPFRTPDVTSCSSIIELTLNQINHPDLLEYVAKLECSLRLFKVGDVRFIKEEVSTSSLFQINGMPISTGIKHSVINYGLNSNEREPLKNYLEKIIEFLPNGGWESKKSEYNPIYISIDRYNESLLDRSFRESKITKTITCLESLFLKGSERTELNHKLSQRVAFLLEYFGDDPLEVYSNLKSAYNIRSTYIHGSMIKDSLKPVIPTLISPILNYARISIIFYIEFSKFKNKEEVLDLIDKAIISSKSKKELWAEFDSRLSLNKSARSEK